MRSRRAYDEEDMAGFFVLVLILSLVVAVYFLYQGSKLVGEGVRTEPQNPLLLGAGVATLLFLSLTLLSEWFLLPAGVSLLVLVATGRMIQLRHTALMERYWTRGAFLDDVLRERW